MKERLDRVFLAVVGILLGSRILAYLITVEGVGKSILVETNPSAQLNLTWLAYSSILLTLIVVIVAIGIEDKTIRYILLASTAAFMFADFLNDLLMRLTFLSYEASVMIVWGFLAFAPAYVAVYFIENLNKTEQKGKD